MPCPVSLASLLSDEKSFGEYVENIDQLREIVRDFEAIHADNRTYILSFVLTHHAVFVKLVDDMDALLQLAKIFPTERYKQLILDKLISNRKLFNSIIPNLEVIAIASEYFPEKTLLNAHAVYTESFSDVLDKAVAATNIDLLLRLKKVTYEEMQEQKWSSTELTEMAGLVRGYLDDEDLSHQHSARNVEMREILSAMVAGFFYNRVPTLTNLCLNFFAARVAGEEKAEQKKALLDQLPDHLADTVRAKTW